MPIRLADAAFKGESNVYDKVLTINTLGAAALSRGPVWRHDSPAGGSESTRRQGGTPQTLAFLAMAHQRQGNLPKRPFVGSTGCVTVSPARSRRNSGRAGNPPASQRGRGSNPLRPSVPGRSVGKVTVAKVPRRCCYDRFHYGSTIARRISSRVTPCFLANDSISSAFFRLMKVTPSLLVMPDSLFFNLTIPSS